MDFELAQALKAIGESVDVFKSQMRAMKSEQDALREYLQKLEAKQGRPGFGGDFASRAEIETERKNLNAFVRGDFKAMTVSIDPQAGYLVPSILQPSIIEKMYDPPTLLSLVRVEQWDGGGSTWIEPLKRAFVTARRRGSETEPAQDTGTASPVGLLQVEAGEGEASCTLSQKLLDDVSRDLSSMVIGDISAALDRQIDSEIVIGTAANSQAQGFLSASVPIVTTDDSTRAWGSIQYTPSGAAAAVTGDGIKTLVWSLRAPYRAGASFVMSSSTASAVDKLKDGSGAYLWREAFGAGQPPTLCGFPVYFDENLPAIAAGTYPIGFGNWRMAYVVARKLGLRLLRDPFTSKPSTVLYGYRRQGGAPANSEAVKVMKIGLT